MRHMFYKKGQISRFARYPAVEKGKWYYGFICKGCTEPIYVLKNPIGNVSNLFVGEGQFSVPC
jgi:hypothetical protein